MTEITNEQRATTALVEKFVGTAYDKMAALYDQLPWLLTLLDTVTEFTESWLGLLEEHPETRTNGDPLEDGDRYYNINSKTTFIFSEGAWLDSNALVSTVEVFTIDAGHISGDDTVLTLENPYTPDGNNVIVFVGTTHQFSISSRADGAYLETDEKTITFPDTHLVPGEIVTVQSTMPLSTVTPLISVKTALYIGETVDQTVIPLPTGFTYVPGEGNLEVHVKTDGKSSGLLYSGIHYTETSSGSITLSTPIQPGDQIIFKQGDLVANFESNQNPITVISAPQDFYTNNATLNTQHAVVTRGGNTVADGSGGLFTFDPTYEKNQANGITVYDPDKNALTQGSSTGFGCWIRQYESRVHAEWWNTPNLGMAALRSITAKEGDTIELLGFYEDSVIGGGIFVWDPAMDATEHNGGTIISPLVTVDPGTTAWYVAPGAGIGCWVRQEVGQLSANWFGIPLDGVTPADDALTAAVAVGNPEVPAGTYEVTGAIVGSFYSYGTTVINTGSVTTIKDLLA